jgi:hypothetical protein
MFKLFIIQGSSLRANTEPAEVEVRESPESDKKFLGDARLNDIVGQASTLVGMTHELFYY